MKFSYKRFSKNIARPVIPITLASHGTSVGYEVLVDSGADLCIFHAEIGELLNIDIIKGKKHEVFGVGGKASIFYVHPIDIIVGEHTVHTKAGFMHDVAGKRMPYGILGQKGFFEHFRVKFDLQKGEIELRHNSQFKWEMVADPISPFLSHFFDTFAELFSHFPSADFGGDSIENLLAEIYTFYSKEDEKKYGVVGMRFVVF